MVNYANFNQACVDTAMTPFMQYLPFILLLQAVSVIMIEKMLMKFPRVAGKIERFYGSIVEEALFGKDPDVAEDVMDDKANIYMNCISNSTTVGLGTLYGKLHIL